MKRGVAAGIVCISTCAFVFAGENAKEEAGKLQGTWKVESAVMGGQNIPLDKLGIEEIVFAGDKMSYQRQGKAIKTFGYKLDPRAKPKHLDWINLEANKPLPGIYELNGDTLKLCFPLLPGKDAKTPVTIERPTNFETANLPRGVIVARKVKS
jgi:uncharacterized protein (TIGR03067 family)